MGGGGAAKHMHSPTKNQYGWNSLKGTTQTHTKRVDLVTTKNKFGDRSKKRKFHFLRGKTKTCTFAARKYVLVRLCETVRERASVCMRVSNPIFVGVRGCATSTYQYTNTQAHIHALYAHMHTHKHTHTHAHTR